MTLRRARSRRTSNHPDEKKVLWQTGAMIAGSIVIAILFLIFIMPRAVDLAFNLIDDETSVFQEVDSIPPQPPVFSAPPSATSSTQVALTGFSEANSTVNLIVNGEKVSEKPTGEDGEFEIELTLQQGENTVTAVAEDAAGNTSPQSREYKIVIDSEDPEIQLEQPEDGATFYGLRNQTVTIRGVTEPGAEVYINGSITFADAEEGTFETSYRLEEGDNELTIRAVDAAENEAEIKRVVRFEQ